MLNLHQPWQSEPKARNVQRDEDLAKVLKEAEAGLAEAAEHLAKIRENVGSPDYWVRPNEPAPGEVDYGLTRGRASVVAEAVASAQRDVWQATEKMLAAVSLASSYETTVEG